MNKLLKMLFLIFLFTVKIYSIEMEDLYTISTIHIDSDKQISITINNCMRIQSVLFQALRITSENIYNAMMQPRNKEFKYGYIKVHKDLTSTLEYEYVSELQYDPTHPDADEQGFFWVFSFDYNKELENIERIVILLKRIDKLKTTCISDVSEYSIIEETLQKIK